MCLVDAPKAAEPLPPPTTPTTVSPLLSPAESAAKAAADGSGAVGAAKKGANSLKIDLSTAATKSGLSI